tara:strand:- start:583 stop:1164 length:582 start_codon:yes stop_codon:yes gene_type:complete
MWIIFLLSTLLGCKKNNTKLENNDTMSSGVEVVDDILYNADCRNEVGGYACDIQAFNDLGNNESLYDYYGMPIVLDFSAMWCGPCNMAASDAQEIQDHYAADDLVYITILIENRQGVPPVLEDLEWWVDNYNITSAPVWGADRRLLNNDDPTLGWFLQSWPTFWFINEDLEVVGYMRGYSEEGVIHGIDQIIQ